MYREIKKRKVILESRKPYEIDIVNYINEYNLTDCIYTSMKLDGSAITKEAVNKILKGEFVDNATLGDHVLIENYKNTMRALYQMLDLKISLDIKCINKFYKILSGEEEPEYRKSNPVLFQYDYNPPHPQDVEERLHLMMQWLYRQDEFSNPIEKAVLIHCRIIEIYPFEKFTEAIARMSMNYILLSEGYPPVGITLSETEYNGAIAGYLKNEEIQPLYHSVERSIYNKLEIILQLTSID